MTAAKVMAGGQSLVPLMKLRFAAPEAIVDLNRIPGSRRARARRTGRCGSARSFATRPASGRSSSASRYRALGDAAPQISDPLVRNRGTVVRLARPRRPPGRLGIGDAGRPGRGRRAELGRQRGRSRSTSSSTGPFTTTLAPNEILTEVRVPDPGPRAGGTYLKLERKVGDYATAAVAVQLSLSNGTIARGRHRAHRRRRRRTSARRAAEDAPRAAPSRRRGVRRSRAARRRGCAAADDIRGTADYKRNVVRVFTERGLRAAAAAAQAA